MSSMNGHAEPPAGDLLSRLQAFRRSDEEREQMVEQLIQDFELLKNHYLDKCNDYENETQSRRKWQTQAREAETALTNMRQSSASNPFAMAIIDGDGALFLDELYARGKDGGAEAAQLLHDEIRNQLRTFYPEDNTSGWSIYVTIVLNMQGLASKLQACGLVTANELTAFARAFGLAQPLFQFVDVGGGKERADHKVRETLRFFLPIAQCKHVFFGPCSDNGYLPVLEPYKRDTTVKDRLTLIESRPAEPGFVDLGFKRVRFPSIFRSDLLPARYGTNNNSGPPVYAMPTRTKSSFEPNTAPLIPPTSTSPAPSSDFAVSGNVPAHTAATAATSSWATVGKGAGGKTINVASRKTPPRKFILLNAWDDRLDTPLPASVWSAEARLAERVRDHGNLCNNYHLSGKCEGEEFCDYHHGETLSPGEKLVLMHKARSLGCSQKSFCRDVNCYLGHHCKYGKRCLFHPCRLGDSHNVDPEPAKKIYEDGTEEWIQAYLDKHSCK